MHHAVYQRYRQRSFQDDLDIPQRTERCITEDVDVRPGEVEAGVAFSGALKLRRVMDRKSAALQKAGWQNGLPFVFVTHVQ